MSPVDGNFVLLLLKVIHGVVDRIREGRHLHELSPLGIGADAILENRELQRRKRFW